MASGSFESPAPPCGDSPQNPCHVVIEGPGAFQNTEPIAVTAQNVVQPQPVTPTATASVSPADVVIVGVLLVIVALQAFIARQLRRLDPRN